MDEPIGLARPKTLTSAVVDRLRDGILRGEFAPGEQLRELPMSRALATSRGTVREALRVLHEAGLVTIVPHQGAVVAEITPRRVGQTFQLRIVLECLAVEHALECGHVDDAAIVQMTAAYDRLCAAAKTSDAFEIIEADMAFHEQMAQNSHNELLLEHLGALRLQTRQAVSIFYARVEELDLTDEAETHRPILDAVIEGDPAKASEAVRLHIAEAGERLVARMLAAEQR